MNANDEGMGSAQNSGSSRAHARDRQLVFSHEGTPRVIFSRAGEDVRVIVGGEGWAFDANEQTKLAAWLEPAVDFAPPRDPRQPMDPHEQALHRLGLEFSADGYAILSQLDGDAGDDGREIISGGEVLVRFQDGEEGERVREQLLDALVASQGTSTKPERPTCASCEHWDDDQDGEGLHSPVETVWPRTTERSWCGQHSSLSVVIEGVRDRRDDFHSGDPLAPVTEFRWADHQPPAGAPQPLAWLSMVADAAQLLDASKSPGLIPGLWLVGGRELTEGQLIDLARQRLDAKLGDVPQ
jgi:hypothetical protein